MLDKHGYSDYKKRFPNPIKKSEDLIEGAWVKILKGNSVTGAIFYLKNAFSDDYRDKREQELDVNIEFSWKNYKPKK